MESRSIVVREFDDLRSDVRLVAMELPSVLSWIWMKN